MTSISKAIHSAQMVVVHQFGIRIFWEFIYGVNVLSLNKVHKVLDQYSLILEVLSKGVPLYPNVHERYCEDKLNFDKRVQSAANLMLILSRTNCPLLFIDQNGVKTLQ